MSKVVKAEPVYQISTKLGYFYIYKSSTNSKLKHIKSHRNLKLAISYYVWNISTTLPIHYVLWISCWLCNALNWYWICLLTITINCGCLHCGVCLLSENTPYVFFHSFIHLLSSTMWCYVYNTWCSMAAGLQM